MIKYLYNLNNQISFYAREFVVIYPGDVLVLLDRNSEYAAHAWKKMGLS